MSPVPLATWHTCSTKRFQLCGDLSKEGADCHLLEHDLVGALDKVLPDRLSDLRVAVDEVISPKHIHGSHIVDGSELLC